MANLLFFRADDVARVVADARKAKPEQRRATLEQLIKGGAYDESFNLNEEIRDSVTKALPPELCLTKDWGVY